VRSARWSIRRTEAACRPLISSLQKPQTAAKKENDMKKALSSTIALIVLI